jgi:hypothetical protein
VLYGAARLLDSVLSSMQQRYTLVLQSQATERCEAKPQQLCTRNFQVHLSFTSMIGSTADFSGMSLINGWRHVDAVKQMSMSRSDHMHFGGPPVNSIPHDKNRGFRRSGLRFAILIERRPGIHGKPAYIILWREGGGNVCLKP